jgi:hypothetical protein
MTALRRAPSKQPSCLIRANHGVSSEPKDCRMSLIRVAVTAGVGLLLGFASASAAPINPAGPQTIRPDAAVEQIYYRNSAAVPEAIIGGILSGVVGGSIGGSCYYNDCGYGDGYYGGGGYVGGGGRGFRGGRGGGGHVGGGGRASAGHAGGGGHGRR